MMRRSTETSISNAGNGIAGGIAGAAVMSLIMLIGKQAGVIRQPIPHRIWRNLEKRLGFAKKTGRQEERLLGQTLHFGLGAGWGMLYGLVSPIFGFSGLLWGFLYGLGTYVMDEMVMGPALSLAPPPEQEPQRTVIRRVLMHVTFGLVTATVFDRLRGRRF